MISAEINKTLLKSGERFSEKRLSAILPIVSRKLKIKDYIVSIAFVDEKTMQSANRTYRGKNEVTDILSFQLTKNSGELLISYSQAKRHAKEMKYNIQDEITFLIVHGLLHLFGYDHEKSKDAKKMFELHEEIIKKL
jgi:probable rRNA maturation factor